jgi:hypothetical protein
LYALKVMIGSSFATDMLHAVAAVFFAYLSFRRDKKKVRRGAGRSARGLSAHLTPLAIPLFSCYLFFKEIRKTERHEIISEI